MEGLMRAGSNWEPWRIRGVVSLESGYLVSPIRSPPTFVGAALVVLVVSFLRPLWIPSWFQSFPRGIVFAPGGTGRSSGGYFSISTIGQRPVECR